MRRFRHQSASQKVPVRPLVPHHPHPHRKRSLPIWWLVVVVLAVCIMEPQVAVVAVAVVMFLAAHGQLRFLPQPLRLVWVALVYHPTRLRVPTAQRLSSRVSPQPMVVVVVEVKLVAVEQPSKTDKRVPAVVVVRPGHREQPPVVVVQEPHRVMPVVPVTGTPTVNVVAVAVVVTPLSGKIVPMEPVSVVRVPLVPLRLSLGLPSPMVPVVVVPQQRPGVRLERAVVRVPGLVELRRVVTLRRIGVVAVVVALAPPVHTVADMAAAVSSFYHTSPVP